MGRYGEIWGDVGRYGEIEDQTLDLIAERGGRA